MFQGKRKGHQERGPKRPQRGTEVQNDLTKQVQGMNTTKRGIKKKNTTKIVPVIEDQANQTKSLISTQKDRIDDLFCIFNDTFFF